jgi:hypothetical protein
MPPSAGALERYMSDPALARKLLDSLRRAAKVGTHVKVVRAEQQQCREFEKEASKMEEEDRRIDHLSYNARAAVLAANGKVRQEQAALDNERERLNVLLLPGMLTADAFEGVADSANRLAFIDAIKQRDRRPKEQALTKQLRQLPPGTSLVQIANSELQQQTNAVADDRRSQITELRRTVANEEANLVTVDGQALVTERVSAAWDALEPDKIKLQELEEQNLEDRHIFRLGFLPPSSRGGVRRGTAGGGLDRSPPKEESEDIP